MKGKIIALIIGIAIIAFLSYSFGLITSFEIDYSRLSSVYEKHGMPEGIFTPTIDEEGFKQEMQGLKNEFSNRIIQLDESRAVTELASARLELLEAVNLFEEARANVLAVGTTADCSSTGELGTAINSIENAIAKLESSLSSQENAVARLGEKLPQNEREMAELEKSLQQSLNETRQELREFC